MLRTSIKLRLFSGLSCRIRYSINTEIIKKYQEQLIKSDGQALKQYPKTFEQKMVLLNDPKSIQVLQVIQYGVQYKQGKNWLPVVLLVAAFLGYYLNKLLPIRINDRYFKISPESSNFISGYIFAGFNYAKPFYLYIFLFLGLHQFSKFISLANLAILTTLNCIVGGLLGKSLVDERVKKYEVWEHERICFGEGNLLSLVFTFWTMLGFKGGFTHLKSKIFLSTVPGVGVIRRGFPVAYLCIIYSLLEAMFYSKGAKNSEVIVAQACVGILSGLILKKYRPIIK